MTEDQMAEAMNGKLKVRFGGRVGYIVDSYRTSNGQTVAVVSPKAEGIASGNNVLLSTLELVKE